MTDFTDGSRNLFVEKLVAMIKLLSQISTVIDEENE